MKRRLEGNNKHKKAILNKSISSGFDRLSLWFNSAQEQLDIYKEALRQAQEEIEKFQSMYTDFYEFAPVGYLTLDKKGKINGANLMAASLLGKGRSRLLQTALLVYLLKEDWSVFQTFLNRIIETSERQTCEVRVKRKEGRNTIVGQPKGMGNGRPTRRIARGSAGFT